MSNNGYAAAHRSVFNHPAFRNDSEALAFVWMIMKAQWKDGRVNYKGRWIDLKRGQLAITQRDMAKAIDRDKAWIERLWKRLKSCASIKAGVEAGREATFTVITICNYDKYQARTDDREAAGEADVRQGSAIEQEGKKVRRKKDTASAVSPGLAPKMPLQEAVDNWNSMAARHGWKTIISLNDKRSEHLRSRLREHGLKGWIAALHKAAASPYLGGSDPPPWFSFDWLAKSPTNFLKLMEGNYDRSRSTEAARDPTTVALERLLAGE